LGWDFTDAKNTKELNLTHNLIAFKAGFEDLMNIYDKDPIISLKGEIVSKIKKDSILIPEEMTFEEVVNFVPIRNRQKELKINLIKQNPDQLNLYNMLKDKPFSVVRKIYLDKDSLIDDKKDDIDSDNKKGSKRDRLIKHLFKIQGVIFLYESGNYNEFIRKTDYKITTVKAKKAVKEIIEQIKNMGNRSIGEVINFADTNGLCRKDDYFNEFLSNNPYLFHRVSQVKFCCFQKLYSYLEGYTPFSTQHKVKGSEYNNVFVILDNGNWNNYNFARLFGEGTGSENVLKRTQKIFYVCCTRAKDNLVVYYNNPSNQVIRTAKELFGVDNVHECEQILC
jgi:DNA helicase-2/ATP-dependent DNA helicase PcrA